MDEAERVIEWAIERGIDITLWQREVIRWWYSKPAPARQIRVAQGWGKTTLHRVITDARAEVDARR